MRSHSETRWARFMDAVGIQWIYEPEPVNTRHGWYLPDFYLPGAGIYVEVKGPGPTAIELEKGQDLQKVTGCPIVFAWGDMHLDGDAVCGGMLGCFGPKGFVSYSTFEMAKLIRLGLGEEAYRSYLRAGIKTPVPSVVQMGEVLQQVLEDMMSRGDREKAHSQHHRALNSIRLTAARAIGRAEWALGNFLRGSTREAQP